MNHPFYSSNPQFDPSDTTLSSQVRTELCLGRCGRVLCWELRIAVVRAELWSSSNRMSCAVWRNWLLLWDWCCCGTDVVGLMLWDWCCYGTDVWWYWLLWDWCVMVLAMGLMLWDWCCYGTDVWWYLFLWDWCCYGTDVVTVKLCVTINRVVIYKDPVHTAQ
jgi:hypothetical protein